MLKFLLILFLVGYVVLRIGGFIFKLFASVLGNGERQGNFNSQTRQPKKKAPGSNLNIDHIPQTKNNTTKDLKDGEYVDYEELK